MSNPEFVGKSIALVIMGAYLVYRVCKLPKKIAICTGTFLVIVFATTFYLATFYPEIIIKLMEKLDVGK